MDFDNAKENIQPLPEGRNATILQALMRTDSSQELQLQRGELERAIHEYSGDDPLEPWYTYISWIEQSYPSGGKESGLEEVLTKCLSRFEGEERYYQDRRMIKLYIKFIDCHKNPTECYQQLFNAGIGTMVADLYTCWAYYYDMSGNTRKADEIFRRGLACRAQPLEELQEAHQHFGFSVAQRFIYKDDDIAKEDANRQLQERRFALTSLRGYRRKANVGSIRTGAAVKNFTPGIIQTDAPSCSHRLNSQVRVLSDENEDPNRLSTPAGQFDESTINPAEVRTITAEDGRSVVRSIIDSARNQENQKEPGPWNKAYDKKKANKLFSKTKKINECGFSILEDDNDLTSAASTSAPIVQQKQCSVLIEPIKDVFNIFDVPFKKPENFFSKNIKQQTWLTPVTIENEPEVHGFPQYNKCALYPRPNIELQLEEYIAYLYYKRKSVSNVFTEKYNEVWSNHNVDANVRMYPNFAKKSRPQKREGLDEYWEPQHSEHLRVPQKEIYNTILKEEFQVEELLAQRWYSRVKRNETIFQATDMEETVCETGEHIQRRKSFFPIRKSIAPFRGNGRKSVMLCTATLHETLHEEDFEKEQVQKEQSATSMVKSGCLEEVKQNINTHAEKTLKTSNTDKSKSEVGNAVESPEHAFATPMLADSTSKAFIPLEIYQDPTPATRSSTESPVAPEEFQFKAPALPVASAKVNKNVFEIYTDETTTSGIGTEAAPAPGPAAAGGIFDPEETCSTQTFNIFLHSQSVSTPMAPQKGVARQFGTLLKELPISTTTKTCLSMEQYAAENEVVSPLATEDKKVMVSTPPDIADCIVAVNSMALTYSPLKNKQLSTILETSEHASTQGTHTTAGTSSKSTISSPEFEAEGLCAPIAPFRFNVPHTELEPLQEQSRESSVTADFLQPKQAGNFSRLEDNEDISTGYSVRPVRFQEDKTETFPKMVHSLRQDHKFQEDKTETISKILFAPTANKLEEDKTATLPKMPYLPATSFDNANGDDLFEFFGKSPNKKVFSPKLKVALKDDDAKSPLASGAKRFCDKATPNISNKSTLELAAFGSHSRLQNSIVNFESSFMPLQLEDSCFVPETQVHPETSMPETKKNLTDLNRLMPGTNERDKAALGDFFIKDFSLKTENQSKMVNSSKNLMELYASSNALPFKAAQTNLNHSDDSVLPDFSMIMGSQPIDESASRWKKQQTVQEPRATQPQIQEVSQQILPSDQKHTSDFFIKSFSMTNQTKDLTKSSSKLVLNRDRPINFLNESSMTRKETKETMVIPNTLDISKESNKTKAQFFEMSDKTENFTSSNCLIKNSTWLPHHPMQSQIQDKSLHIKAEIPSPAQHSSLGHSFTIFKSPPLPGMGALHPEQKSKAAKLSFLAATKEKSLHQNDAETGNIKCDFFVRKQQQEQQQQPQKQAVTNISNVESLGQTEEQTSVKIRPTFLKSEDDESSIYYKNAPKTPTAQLHNWSDELDAYACLTPEQNNFVHQSVSLDQTQRLINNICLDVNVNPFNADLINAFLEQIDFTSYIEQLPNCELLGRISRINLGSVVKVKTAQFQVLKLIGEGAYGSVYSAKESKTGKLYALKQERPPNYWEYYICLEVQSRISVDEMLPAFMCVDYALVGHNSSILVSPFYSYGSIINVCNKVKRYTMKNVDEHVVMHMVCELLEVIDHLHAINIIHADVKADNVLIMNKLTYNFEHRALHLIDFGVSIDMKLFKPGQTFSYVNKDNAFKCVEMHEERPWSYQLDLYGVAGIVHVLLFGKYMNIEKRVNGMWMHKSQVPRYLNRELWENIFQTLLNVPNCRSMPNLQQLRVLLKEELVEREKLVRQKIDQFNRALQT